MHKMKVQYCGADTAFVPVIVVSILDMLFSTTVLVLLAFVAYVLTNPEDLEKVVMRTDPTRSGNLANLLNKTTGEKVMSITIPLVSNILGFFMGLFLLIVAIKKSINALKIWFTLTMIFMFAQSAVFITQISSGLNDVKFIVPGLLEYVYRIYGLWVVKRYICELYAVKESSLSTDSDDTVVVEAENIDPELAS